MFSIKITIYSIVEGLLSLISNFYDNYKINLVTLIIIVITNGYSDKTTINFESDA